MRIGFDGFLLRETVVAYYQVARLTPSELKQRGIVAPPEYLAELERHARRAKSANGASDDEAADATTPLYGGGVLVFDEYGQLKYQVSNDVFGKKRQSARLKYLWESGLLEPGTVNARLRPARLSSIHRMRALDVRRFPAEGW
jgi:hypothetical protein